MNNDLLKLMLTVSREMAMTHDLDLLLSLALEQTLEIIGAQLCYLILLKEDGTLDFRVRTRLPHSLADSGQDELSHTIFHEVVRIGAPVVITDALSDPVYASRSSIVDLQVRSVMCVPLIAQRQPMGAIYVENRSIRGAFRQEDLEPLIFFANQAAACIENARLIATLEERVAVRTRALESAWHDAVDANRMRTTLLGQLAHDMRTPATVIRLALENLHNPRVGPLTEMQQRWVGRAASASDQLGSLITNIFDLTRVELNTLEVNAQPVPLLPFLTRVYDIGLGLPWQPGVVFRASLPPDLPVISMDEVRIQQVLMNLIGNALKFTAAGEVVLYAAAHTDHVQIGVRDTGEGISPESQPLLFDRFRQFDTDQARRSGGAGLGLAICRELVERHGGHIRVTSVPGSGADFVFTLPLGSRS
jgi:signal transduction histidine kinase